MKFKYQAINKDGQPQKGIVEATSRRSALQVLINNELRVTSIVEEKNDFLHDMLKVWEGVKDKEFVVFSRQLSVMIEAKVPLIVSLQSIANQSDNAYFSLKIRSIVADIDGGTSFSDALAKHPDVFSKFYVNMVKAGEASGTLQKTLNDLADNIEKNYELKAKLQSAMYYPGFILFAMVAVGFVVMSFVMPKLLEMLKGTDVTLPLQTRILITVSDFMAVYWWAVLIVLVAGFSTLVYYIRTEEGKREFDQILLKIPIIGRILKNIYIARMAENLSTLVKSGLPITSSLIITSEVVGNDVYRQILKEASEEIKKGGSMADIFKKYDLIPPVVVQMISIGENTGRIDFTLKKVTDFYNKEADHMVKNFTTLIEPVIMVILAVGVGIMVSAVLLPIYQVATSIK